jgi:hypothetical protein
MSVCTGAFSGGFYEGVRLKYGKVQKKFFFLTSTGDGQIITGVASSFLRLILSAFPNPLPQP